MNDSKIFLDTNLLIYNTFEDNNNDKHIISKQIFEYLENNNFDLYISNQIIREFYAIATNNKFFDKPLSVDQAIFKIEEFQKHFIVLNDGSIEQLKELIKAYNIKKQKIHDTNIVATMLSHNINYISTFNIKDFKIFDGIKIFEL